MGHGAHESARETVLSLALTIFSKRYSKFQTKTLFFIALRISNSVPNSYHSREVLLHFFISKKTAAERHHILVKVYSEHAVSETTCIDWFWRFKSGDFDLSNKDRGKQPKKIWRCRIADIAGRKFNSTQTIHWKDPEKTKMGAVRIKRKRHWKAKNHFWNVVWSFQKKVIFASHCYWRWKVDLFRQSQAQKIVGGSGPTINNQYAILM